MGSPYGAIRTDGLRCYKRLAPTGHEKRQKKNFKNNIKPQTIRLNITAIKFDVASSIQFGGSVLEKKLNQLYGRQGLCEVYNASYFIVEFFDGCIHHFQFFA